MPANEPLNFEQPKNRLSDIADGERKKLIPKNDYKKTGNEYSSVNPDALADGDAKGRGTGGDLDVYNETAGTLIDIVERKNEVKLNFYKSNSPYTTPST